MRSDLSSFIFGAIGCSVTVGTVLWRVITLKVSSELLLLRHDLEKKDLQIANLQDVQTLLQNGIKEKFEHFSNRVKDENSKLDKRVKHTEYFLSKTTEFEPRD